MTNREILGSVFARTSQDQKKLLNNWCRAQYGVALQLWIGGEEEESEAVKAFDSEVNSAIEADNWSFFNPETNNPSEGQAVETAPVPAVPANPEPEETNEVQTEEERSTPTDATADTEEEEDYETEPAPPPVVTAHADPLEGLVATVAQRVAGSLKPPRVNVAKAVDKHLQNGGFPVDRVNDLIDQRMVSMIVAFLRSQPEKLTRQAIEQYENV